MMTEKRNNPLEDEIFDYWTTKDGKVFITWYGKTVTTLAKKKAQRFLRQIETAGRIEAQHLMARYTGNFKRGNERDNKDV
jgi:hypothetical protein